MDADSSVILFTVGNKSGKFTPCLLGFDIFPFNKLLGPCQIFQTLFSSQNHGPLPRFKAVGLRITPAMMMGIMVKSILGYTFLCRENIGDETGPQGDVKVNSAQVPVCAIPQTVKNSQTALLSIPCMGQFPENFRMGDKPPGKRPVPELSC